MKPTLRAWALGVAISLTALTGVQAADSKAPSMGRKPASIGSGNSDMAQPLEIKGQSRMLNMRLMIQNKKEKLKFVEPRRNYQQEILNTHY